MKYTDEHYISVQDTDLIKAIFLHYGLRLKNLHPTHVIYSVEDLRFNDVQPEPLPDWVMGELDFFQKEGYCQEEFLEEILKDMVFKGELPESNIQILMDL